MTPAARCDRGPRVQTAVNEIRRSSGADGVEQRVVEALERADGEVRSDDRPATLLRVVHSPQLQMRPAAARVPGSSSCAGVTRGRGASWCGCDSERRVGCSWLGGITGLGLLAPCRGEGEARRARTNRWPSTRAIQRRDERAGTRQRTGLSTSAARLSTPAVQPGVQSHSEPVRPGGACCGKCVRLRDGRAELRRHRGGLACGGPVALSCARSSERSPGPR